MGIIYFINNLYSILKKNKKKTQNGKLKRNINERFLKGNKGIIQID